MHVCKHKFFNPWVFVMFTSATDGLKRSRNVDVYFTISKKLHSTHQFFACAERP
jgi:hypothetical protein